MLASSSPAVADLRVYFGHQSVGANILQGVKELGPTSGLRLAIKDEFLAENGDPLRKLENFKKAVGEGSRYDIALMKFCYVDIDADTDVRALFERYRATLAELRAANPRTSFVHVTLPLTMAQTGPKALAKRLLGRAPYGTIENVRRAEYNSLLRRTYGFRRPADLIATFAQGVDDRRARLVRALLERLRAARADARHLAARVHPGRLAERLRLAQREATGLAQRLQLARATAAAQRVQRVMAARARLFALSPRAVLARGYSLVTLEDGTLVRQARQLAPGRAVTLEFARGRAGARVESVTPEARGPESRTEE